MAGSVVFTAPDHPVSLDNHYHWWSYVHGANWRHPSGPKSDIKGKDQYPVVQVSYEDAEAYAKWTGQRLPTEAEWEFVARGGLVGKPFVWGEAFRPKGKWMANTHQGHFPEQDTGEDGYVGLAPVANTPRTETVFTIWPAMCGSGRAIGTLPTTIRSLRLQDRWREIRKGPKHRLIPPNRVR